MTHELLLGIGAISAVVIFRYPWIGVITLMYLHAFLDENTASLTVYEQIYIILYILTMYSWLLKQLALRRDLLPKTELTVPLVVFLLVGTVSLLPALLNSVGLWSWIVGWGAFLNLLLFFVILTEFDDLNKLSHLVRAFLLTSFFTAWRGIAHFWSTGLSLGSLLLFRGGFIMQFNSGLFIWATMLALGMFVYAEKRSHRLLLGLALLGFAARLAIHGSRVSLVLVSLSILFIAMLARQSGNKRALTLSLILVVALSVLGAATLLASPSLSSFWGMRLSKDLLIRGQTVRFEEYASAFPSIVQSPVLGKGFGYTYRRQGSLAGRFMIAESGLVHSFPIYLLLHVGIIGALAFYWLLLRGLKVSLSLSLEVLPKYPRGWQGIIVGLVVLVFLLSLNSFISGSLHRPEMTFTLAFSWGVVFSLRNLQEGVKRRRALRCAGTTTRGKKVGVHQM